MHDSLPSLVNAWLLDCHRRNLSMSTIKRGYALVLRDFFRWLEGDPQAAKVRLSLSGRQKVVRVDAPEVDLAAADVDLELLRQFIDHKRSVKKFSGPHPWPWIEPIDKPLSPSTIHKYVSVLKNFFNWLAHEEFLERSPAERLRFPKLPNKGRRIEVFNPDEIDVILSMAKQTSYRSYAIVLTLLDTLLRRKELVSLTVDDVNLTTGLITVRHAKGDKVRWVRAGRVCQRTLRKYARLREPQGDHVDAFWLNRFGRPLSNNALGSMFRRLSDRTGVHVYAHKLRHTGATLMAAQGENAPRIADRLGHESLEMAQWYIHLSGMQGARSGASPVDRLLDTQ